MLKHVRRPLDLLLTSKAALSHLSQHKTALIHLVHLHSMTPNFAPPLTSTCYSPWLSKIPDHRPDHRWTGPGSLAMELPLLRPVGPGPPGRDMKGRRGAITGNEGGGGRGSRCLTRSLEANPELLHVSFHARPLPGVQGGRRSSRPRMCPTRSRQNTLSGSGWVRPRKGRNIPRERLPVQLAAFLVLEAVA
jgi:hypothetical protein